MDLVGKVAQAVRSQDSARRAVEDLAVLVGEVREAASVQEVALAVADSEDVVAKVDRASAVRTLMGGHVDSSAIGVSKVKFVARSHSHLTTPSGMPNLFRSPGRAFLNPLMHRVASA